MAADEDVARQARRHSDSLIFNVSTLLQESIGSLRRYEIVNASCVGLDTLVSGQLRMLRTDQSVLATAQLSTLARDLCGGCLNSVEMTLAIAFDEEFWPASDAITGERLDPPPERLGFSVIDSQIDLSEAVRQYMEMARPMSPRCGSDCPGLSDTEPSEATVDDRWAPLANLKQALEAD